MFEKMRNDLIDIFENSRPTNLTPVAKLHESPGNDFEGWVRAVLVEMKASLALGDKVGWENDDVAEAKLHSFSRKY